MSCRCSIGILITWCLFSLLACSEICEPTDELLSCFTKILSFEAIGEIHRNLDGDKNGEVDYSETEKFLRKEFNSADAVKKSRILSSDDPLISLTDLWQMWRNNPAFNWTVKDTIQWLTGPVDLPQYADVFRQHHVDGRSLPRLAMQNMSYLTDVLRIQNPIHKKKLMLRALDIILFGPPRHSVFSSVNVSFVTLSLGLLCISVASLSHWFCHASSNSEKQPAGKKQEKLDSAEQTLKQLQKRLNDVEQLRQTLNAYELNHRFTSSSALLPMSSQCTSRENISSCQTMNTKPYSEKCLPINKQSLNHLPYNSNSITELTLLTDLNNDSIHSNVLLNQNIHSDCDLVTADQIHSLQHHRKDVNLKEFKSIGNSSVNESYLAANELKHWLQVTYELELKRYCEKKIEAEKKLNFARQACKRFNRKRYNVLGSLRLVHTDNLDELEKRLVIAKLALDQLQSEVQERIHRWSRIEALSGHLIRTDVRNEHGKGITRDAISPIQCSIDRSKFYDNEFKESDSDHLSASEQTFPEPKRLFKLNSNDSVTSFDFIHDELSFCSKDSMLQSSNTEGSDFSKTSSIPRNYSFVRPFATLWRRKTKSGRGKSDSKQLL
uniref:SAM domain-containing protein n=1 Tax=Trichobilharzia regenti TaxID=157069 RepID=A0AA85ISB2_TRIRE|nr:unnamed protein product [Trichobilharzia regenti]